MENFASWLEEREEWLENGERQLDTIAQNIHYGYADDISVGQSKSRDIIAAFETLGVKVPSGVSPELFAAQIKMVARAMAQGGTNWRQLMIPKKIDDSEE